MCKWSRNTTFGINNVDPKITKLDLSALNLDFLPEEIINLLDLTYLDLSNNNLSSLPMDFFSYITKPTEELPAFLCRIHPYRPIDGALQELNLSGNPLDSFFRKNPHLLDYLGRNVPFLRFYQNGNPTKEIDILHG